MKIDLVGPARRGLAMGLNEAAGYGAVAVTALATGYIAADYGLRPAPFFLGLAYAALGLGLSTLFVRETRGHARLEAANHVPAPTAATTTCTTSSPTGEVFTLTSFREQALSSASQAGLVNNLNDGLAWGLFPLLFAAAGLSVGPDRRARRALPGGVGPRAARHRRPVGPIGRKPLIAGGMLAAGRGARPDRRHRQASRAWAARRRRCSAPAPRWSTRPCSPRSATSPTPPGGPARSASTGSGATAASPSAPCSPASSPTPRASAPPSGPSPRSPPPPASWSRCACTRPTTDPSLPGRTHPAILLS